MSFKLGDKVRLRYDDQPENDKIIGVDATVVEGPTSDWAPLWMVVEVDGVEYSVRGSDCSEVT